MSARITRFMQKALSCTAAAVLAASLIPGVSLAAEKAVDASGVATEAAEATSSDEPTEVAEPAEAITLADATEGEEAEGGLEEASEEEASEEEGASEEEELDFYNLPDGLYSVYVEMYKTNARDYSMSNEAVNHTVKLEVEDGVYYLTFDFKGVAMNSMFGYLGKLWYYADGYTISGGAVYGNLIEGEVLSVQTNADGSTLTDEFSQFNNYEPYPNQVRIEYVDTAINDPDDFVALRVFIPVMESISTEVGTQDVLAWIDKDSVAVAEEDDFVDNVNDESDLLTTTTTGGTTTSSTIGTSSSGSTVKSSTLAQTGDDSAALALAAAGLAGAGALALGVSRRGMTTEDAEKRKKS